MGELDAASCICEKMDDLTVRKQLVSLITFAQALSPTPFSDFFWLHRRQGSCQHEAWFAAVPPDVRKGCALPRRS